MTTLVYHQAGHNTKWNIDSYKDDSAGDGIIFAAKHIKKSALEKVSKRIKRKSLFDPNFFFPKYARSSLMTYDFFPDVISEGFNTLTFTEKHANEAAIRCVKFQIEHEFKYIVVPCKYFDGMPSDFAKKQEALFYNFFCDAILNNKTEQKIAIQLVINSNMIKDKEYFDYLLNWATSLELIDALYVILQDDRTSKQINDPELLFQYLRLINELNKNEIEVIVGYCNTEGLLLTLANPAIVTMGSFETQRNFNPKKYDDPSNDKGGPPTPRIYIPDLLQWIEHTYLSSIKAEVPCVYDGIPINKYTANMLSASFNWHHTKPDIYKHYFLEFEQQIKDNQSKKKQIQYNNILTIITNAVKLYEDIKKSPIYLSGDNDSQHLPAWITAAKRFGKLKGW